MSKWIVNGSFAELLISSRWVHLQLRSVLIENCYSAQSVQCPVTLSGNWIMFPADKQLHHVKPPLDLKLISNFAGSLPTERSGRGVTVRMRIPPGKAGGVRGAQTTEKGGCGRAAGDLRVCCSGRDFSLLNTGGAASSRAAPRSPLWELIDGKRTWRETITAGHENQQGWAASPTALPSTSVKLLVTPGRTTQVTPWSQTNRGSVTRGDLQSSFCGTLLLVGEVGGIQIW